MMSRTMRQVGHAFALTCAVGLVPQPLAATPFGVAVKAEQLTGDAQGACRPSFSFTYPTDIEPHDRKVRIQGDNGRIDVEKVWHFPLEGKAHATRKAGIGMTSATFASFEIVPCRPTMWVVTIGPCHSQSCPPMGLLRSAELGQMTVIRKRIDQ